MDHLWIINGSYGGCADKIVGTGEIFRKEKMTNEGIDYRKWNLSLIHISEPTRRS